MEGVDGVGGDEVGQSGALRLSRKTGQLGSMSSRAKATVTDAWPVLTHS